MAEDNTRLINTQELAWFARERSSFYAFLEMHFMTLPDEDFIHQMRNRDLVNAFSALTTDPEINPELAEGSRKMARFLEGMRDVPASSLAQTLGIDRTRLYRGVSGSFGPPPPYEAAWVGHDRGAETVLGKLMTTYRGAGLALGEDSKERADYIGIEIDYLRHMALQEAEAWERDDIQTVADVVRKERMFVEVANEWMPRFIDKAIEFAQTDFYRGHMQMLRGFLADEMERLLGMMNEIQNMPP